MRPGDVRKFTTRKRSNVLLPAGPYAALLCSSSRTGKKMHVKLGEMALLRLSYSQLIDGPERQRLDRTRVHQD